MGIKVTRTNVTPEVSFPTLGKALKNVLTEINAAWASATPLNPVPARLIGKLYDLKNLIADDVPERYLPSFDKIFAACGWSNYGIRWTREGASVEARPFVVEFLNGGKSAWRIA